MTLDPSDEEEEAQRSRRNVTEPNINRQTPKRSGIKG